MSKIIKSIFLILVIGSTFVAEAAVDKEAQWRFMEKKFIDEPGKTWTGFLWNNYFFLWGPLLGFLPGLGLFVSGFYNLGKADKYAEVWKGTEKKIREIERKNKDLSLNEAQLAGINSAIIEIRKEVDNDKKLEVKHGIKGVILAVLGYVSIFVVPIAILVKIAINYNEMIDKALGDMIINIEDYEDEGLIPEVFLERFNKLHAVYVETGSVAQIKEGFPVLIGEIFEGIQAFKSIAVD